MNRQSGQTLIETISAIFILTMSITAALALSIYVFSNSGRAINEIVATNLAREGVDVIRNMRDTNWLESDAKGAAPWDLADCSIGATHFQCFARTWEGVSGGSFHSYSLNNGGSVQPVNYRLDFNNTTNQWSLTSGSSYGLYLKTDGSGAYTSNGSGSPQFVRKITLAHNTTNPPFSTIASNLSELVVTSIVGWSGRGCTNMTGGDPSTTNCNVAITERLTNWKDYK